MTEHTTEKKKIDLLTKVALILFGIFLTSIVFALLTKLFGVTGIWLGLGTNILLVFLGFYYVQEKTMLRIVTWGILLTTLISTIGFIVILQTIENMLEGF